MGIELIFKIAAIGIITAVLNQLLSKAGKEDLGMMISIVGLIIVVVMVMQEVSVLFDTIKTLFEL